MNVVQYSDVYKSASPSWDELGVGEGRRKSCVYKRPAKSATGSTANIPTSEVRGQGSEEGAEPSDERLGEMRLPEIRKTKSYYDLFS